YRSASLVRTLNTVQHNEAGGSRWRSAGRNQRTENTCSRRGGIFAGGCGFGNNDSSHTNPFTLQLINNEESRADCQGISLGGLSRSFVTHFRSDLLEVGRFNRHLTDT